MSLTAAAVALMLGSTAPEAGTVAAIDPVAAPQVAMPPQATVLPQVTSVPQATDATVAPAASPASDQATTTATATATATESPVDAAAPVSAAAPDVSAPAAAPDAANGPHTQGSEILVTHRKRPPPGDPMERVNEQSFKAVQAVDKAVLEPVATVYNKGLPRPVRQGLRNFFTNLDEPVIFAAYLLELKPGKAMETAGRFAINTTLGVGGIVDIAKRKPFNLPYRPNGLADVLGYYGVGPGPYMYLPLIGPTTVRDVIGDSVDNLWGPAVLGKPFSKPEVAAPMTVVSELGERAAFDDEIRKIRKSDNPYATYRELYLRQRKAEIDALHGRVTEPVVPVYGPGMRTAGGKKGEQNAVPDPAEKQAPVSAPVTQEPVQKEDKGSDPR
ncbi:phospholipid-binding lipoprotein MlaA [Novosphingobium sp. PhB165]|uniref:MlaA family lipoprotein n=1 Tax=Novosphingobium sp. PhB165 TaxID=2485105 RepID=UPI00104306F4|nr:VacJ family lipoprotein [Novosphingobium sp. PhB165]TCM15362.1 phospholipid-binding lipoprotein MlaA [Novosphingobium sp. PhB165]